MMRKNSLFILLLVALLSLPAFALADSTTDELSGGKGVGWQGIITSGEDAGLYGAAGRARNKYNMACWVMGKNPLTIADEVRSKLSDPNYGGRFYEYANTFESIPSWEYVPEWQPTYANLTYVLYGFDFQWESAVPQSLYEGAKEDFRRILAGEDLGGGGSGGVNVGGFYEMVSSNHVVSGGISDYVATARAAHIDSDGNLVLDSGTMSYSDVIGNGVYVDSVRAYVSPGVFDFIQQNYSSLDYSFFVGMRYRTGNVHADIVIASEFTVSRRDNNGNVRDCVYNTQPSVYCGALVPAYYDSEGVFIVLDDSFLNNGFNALASRYQDPSFYSVPAPVTTVPAAPDGDWPDPAPTPAPTAPEIPTPTAPTDTPDPSPTEPTVVWPTAPIVVNPPDVTVEVTPSGLDYTELLTRINDNLNELNSYVQAINGSLNSLRADIVGGFDDVVTSLRNIYQYLQHLNNILELHCKHLRDALDDGIYNLELYIKSLFEWLPQQLDFDAKFDYDDTAVTSLLRRILGKIPGGSGDAPTSYMPNPQADEPGFFDWLTDLWHRFLIDLVSVLPDELGGLVDAFSQLTHYFPFSIPWDLAALLALFEHEPVTPVFDVPWGFGGDEGEIEMVRVDLSAWDGVMEMVRPVFVVGFCWQLAMITKELLGNFDIKQGGV